MSSEKFLCTLGRSGNKEVGGDDVVAAAAGVKVKKRKNGHIQESKFQITVDLRLERDLDVEVEIQPEPERVALALVAAALLLDGVACDAAEHARRRVDEAACRVLNIVEREVVERALAAALLALVASPLAGLVLL